MAPRSACRSPCCWPVCRRGSGRRMPALLAIAPVPALAGCAAGVRRDAGAAAGAAAASVRARCARRAAARGRGAALDRGRELRLGMAARQARQRPLRGVVAADAERQRRCLHGRRPGELLSGVLHGQPGGLWADRARRHPARPPQWPDLRGPRAARRSLPADGLRAAGANRHRGQSADPRCHGVAADIALAHRHPDAADAWLRREDRAGAVPYLDAARLSRRADPGRCRAQRRRREGRRHRADPLPAAGRRDAGMGRGAGRCRTVRGVLRRRDRHHAAQPQDGAGLFQREPDGCDRRRVRHGACRGQWRRRPVRGLLRGAPHAGEGRTVPCHRRRPGDRTRAACGRCCCRRRYWRSDLAGFR